MSLEKRREEHIYVVGRHKNTYFHNAIRAYGIDNFSWSILAETDSETKLNAMEKFYIAAYRKMGNVYNLTDGGEGSSGRIITEETRKKMSEAQKGKKVAPFSKEHREKISAASRNMSKEQRAAIAKANSIRVITEETKEKLRKRRTGQKHSEESKKKMSISAKGRVFSEEHKAKISAANRLRVCTQETKDKISRANAGRVAWNKGLKKQNQRENEIPMLN